jgi:hypothetical protein
MDIGNVILFCVAIGMFLLAFTVLSHLGHALAAELSLLWAIGMTMAVFGVFMKWAKSEKWQIPFYLGVVIIVVFPFLIALS